MLPVNIPGSRMESLEVDAATTAAEMCSKLANKIGLKDQFGFSIYICLKDKVWHKQKRPKPVFVADLRELFTRV